MLGISLAADLSTEDIVRSILHIANKVSDKVLGPITPAFDLTADIVQKASGRLHILMTKLPEFSNMLINYFTNREDVIDALLCRSFIPMAFVGFLPNSVAIVALMVSTPTTSQS